MPRDATALGWLRAWTHDHSAQLRLCLRVTASAIAAFIFAQFLAVPLAGLWAVMTAVVVTQTSIGGSLKATIEYFVGTLGGAVYAAIITVLVPANSEIGVLAVLALAVAPLALLAALNPHFRIGPFTAVIVVLGGVATHNDPLQSALYRVIEVALGGVTGLVVSFVVLPARARELVIEAAADMLNLMADSLPALFSGCMQPLEAAQIRQVQDKIGAVLTRVRGET
jgi:uncharacterized membrane protein YccC